MTTMPVTPDLPRTRAKLGTIQSIKSLVALAGLLGGCVATALAQTTVISPPSSMPGAASAGVQAHTNLQILGDGEGMTGTPDRAGPPFPGLFYETPAAIACIYGLVPQQPPAAGCNPNTVDANPTGGGRSIAIVDAYDNPNALSDLQMFNSQFGIAPPPNFIVIYAPRGGATPGTCDPGTTAHPPPTAARGGHGLGYRSLVGRPVGARHGAARNSLSH
jgi:hypothetical protein